MAVHRAVGGEEDVDDAYREVFGEVSGAEGEDVGIVVFARVAGGFFVESHAGADARDLVGGHARADTGTVDDDPAQGLAGGDGLSGGAGKHRVVARFLRMRSDIEHVHALLGEVMLDGFLEGEPAVIAAEGHST